MATTNARLLCLFFMVHICCMFNIGSSNKIPTFLSNHYHCHIGTNR